MTNITGDCPQDGDGTGSLKVIDISDPSSPTLADTYDTTGRAKHTFVSGDYAYVADLFGGLVILDISDPTSLIHAGSISTSHQALDVTVSGDYAYVADEQSGLQVFDISDLSNPILQLDELLNGISSFEINENEPDYIYISTLRNNDFFYDISKYDITNPENIEQV